MDVLSRKLRQSRDKEMNVSTKQNNYIYFYHANLKAQKHNTLIIEKKTHKVLENFQYLQITANKKISKIL
jgi:hypothetical protein